MSGGGKRPGAGRPKGAKQKITESVIREAAKAGVTPLEYMLDVMRIMADQDAVLDPTVSAGPDNSSAWLFAPIIPARSYWR